MRTLSLSPLLALVVLLSVTPLVGACSAGDDGAAGTPATDEDEIVRAIRLRELAAGSALRVTVEEQNVEWGDANIMSGSVSVIARKVAPSALARLDRVGRAAFADRIKNEELELSGPVTSKAAQGDAIAEAAKRIALEGFVYADNEGNIAPVRDAVKRLVNALGPPAEIDVVVVEANVVVDSADEDEQTARASTFVFANRRTNELVIFYARKGYV